MSKLLIDEPPLQVLPSLALKIGLEESIFLQQLHYWLRKSTYEHSERKWIFNSYESWQKQFPFWSKKTVQRIILSLKSKKILLTGSFNKVALDKTKWYSIDYNSLEKLIQDSDFPKRDVHEAKLTTWTGQVDHMHEDKLTTPIPEITTETTSKTTTHLPAVVVSQKEIEHIRNVVTGTPYAKIDGEKFSILIREKGYKHVLMTIEMLAYQLRQGAKPPYNPTGHFISLCRKGMEPPPGFVSSEEKIRVAEEKAEQERKKRDDYEALKNEREIPPESQKFLNQFLGRVGV
jgi:hypothetical protein